MKAAVWAVVMLGASAAFADEPSTVSAGARPAEGPQRLGLFVGASVLATEGLTGASLTGGTRLAMGRHLAAGFDFGWGAMHGAQQAEDRWWLMPSLAAVLPLEAGRLELGAGLGLGTASGYHSWAGFEARPFAPDWAFQLAPAARAHLGGAWTVSPALDAFARLEAGTLLLGGNTIGLRSGNPHPAPADTLWLQLTLGVQLRLL